MAFQVRAEPPELALTLQFLEFVAVGTRTYGETMEAWRSTCPKLSIWEDAVRDGLVRIENGGAMKSSRIVLTEHGRARLARGTTAGQALAGAGPQEPGEFLPGHMRGERGGRCERQRRVNRRVGDEACWNAWSRKDRARIGACEGFARHCSRSSSG